MVGKSVKGGQRPTIAILWITRRAGAERAMLQPPNRYAALTLGAVLSGFVGVSEHPYNAMKLPNLYVMVLDILARVFERSRIARRYEIMASYNLASRAQRKCSIVHHDRPSPRFHCSCK